MTKRGIFISLEGPDGSGKSTQIPILCKYLKDLKVDFVFTREPGGTKIGEKIRDLVLDKNHPEMEDFTEALLYAAQRAQHVREFIRPSLEEGRLVVCDRFIDSSIIYQGIARGIGEPVRIINQLAVDGLMPDHTFLIMLDPATGKKRMGNRDKDRLEELDQDFHEKVYRGYMDLAEKYPHRIIVIDGSEKVEEVFGAIKSHLDKILNIEGIRNNVIKGD